MNKKFYSLVLAASLIGGGAFYLYWPVSVAKPHSKTVQTVYGSVEVKEPVLLELLESAAFERLKGVNQYGIMAFVKPEQKYTRYTHSLGVFYLLRRFGAPLEEQVAGLLHDVSHTTFSHVADFLHNSIQDKYSYQDSIFAWYLEKTGLLAILKKHGMERVAQFGNGVEYKMLKADLPNLCADRLEYNIYGGYVEGWINEEQMRAMVDSISYQDDQWMFKDASLAKQFAKISVDLSVQNWCSAQNAFVSTAMANLLKRGFALNIITQDDFHFSTDQQVWDKLRASDDSEMKKLFAMIDNQETGYGKGTKEKHDLYFKGKFRGVDPLVLSNGKATRLTEVDPSFGDYLKECGASVKEHYIAYL